jgi:hypothetical protein
MRLSDGLLEPIEGTIGFLLGHRWDPFETLLNVLHPSNWSKRSLADDSTPTCI